MKNIILNTDSYKTSMFCQYPPNTSGVYSYIESRGGLFDKTLFFGLQGFIKEYLLNPRWSSLIHHTRHVIYPVQDLLIVLNAFQLLHELEFQ